MKRFNSLTIPESLDELSAPHRLALIVYDMQVGVVSQVEDAAKVITQAKAVISAARDAGVRIAYTRHTSFSRDWMGASQMRTAMAWQRVADPEEVTPRFLRERPSALVAAILATFWNICERD